MKKRLLRLAGIAFCMALSAPAAFADSKPNVVIVLADDMGYHDVSYHGSKINTPTIDQLAAQSAILTRFYAQPSCSPTRAALMTGKSAIELGITLPLAKIATKGLPQSETLMPQYFKAAGYQTYMVGKWHLGHATKAMTPNARGFDHFYGYLTGGVGHYDHVHGGGYDWQRNGETVREDGYTTHLLTDEAVKLIEAQDAEKPMFMYLSYAAPHLPNEAPEEAIAAYDGQFESVHRQRHAAMVSELDRGLARVVAALDQAGMMDNTIIWFMSDNGGLIPKSADDVPLLAIVEWAEKLMGTPIPIKALEFARLNAQHGGANNAPYRDGKMSVYEGGVRVPAFIYWPTKLTPRKVDGRITVQDVLPTLSSIIGFDDLDAEALAGQTRWDAITTGKQTAPPDYLTQGVDGQAYYEGDWKLVLRGSAEPELFNLAEDPTEQKDIIAQHPEIAARLGQKVDAAPRGAPVNPPIWKSLIDPDFFGGEEDRMPWADAVKQ